VIYSDNGGSPGAKQGSDSVVVSVSTTHAWYDFKFSSNINLTKGYYWLTLISQSGSLYCAYSSGTTNQLAINSDTYSDGASDPFGAVSSWYPLKISIYATYVVN
jgi:hypothetical protein